MTPVLSVWLTLKEAIKSEGALQMGHNYNGHVKLYAMILKGK